MIHETIVITTNSDGTPHIAPMGVREADGRFVLAPFRPSGTLDNLQRTRRAMINFTDDVRVFAGCLTGRASWPVVRATVIDGWRLEAALAHVEVEVERIAEDTRRPAFHCVERARGTHGAFRGFNRAQAAVIEGAILVSRLHLLPAAKIDAEINYLRISIDKTAGEREQTAWGWLLERIEAYRGGQRQAAG